MKTAPIILLALIGLVVLFWVGTMIGITEMKEPEAKPVFRHRLLDGDFDGAMKQAGKLMVALRAGNWETKHIPSNLLRLPDQDHAPTAFLRHPQMMSFAVPAKHYTEQKDLAFWCSLYTGGTRKRPLGFFIVGLKTGEVKRVPVEDVRCIERKGGMWLYVFPGMAAYKRSLRPYWTPFRDPRHKADQL